jgi:alkylation response protein AidB-like acyl-CoA dehydrogenase
VPPVAQLAALDDRDLIGKARALRELLSANAAEEERERDLSDEVVTALHDAGLLTMLAPKSVGGAEAGPVEALQAIEEVAYGDGSAGWVLLAIALNTGTSAAYLTDAGLARILHDGRLSLLGGQGIPNGRAVPVDGGYLLSGRWGYGSGVTHCDFVRTGAIVMDGDAPRKGADGQAEVRSFIIPREQVEFGDNWHVLGLRATASIDYAIDGLFVPEELTHPHYATASTRGGGFYSLGVITIGCLVHSGFALGVGRRCLDELALLVRESSKGFLAQSENFLVRYAQEEGRLRAARALCFDVWGDVQATLDRGELPTTRQHTLGRYALSHVTFAIAECCSFAYFAGGGVALRESTLQRCFRDIHAGAQHVLASFFSKEAGRELIGLAEGETWQGMSLR